MLNVKQRKEQRAALTLAHHDFQKGLNTHAFFKTSSHTTGENLVQDTFLKTWAYLVKGGKINLMKSFLYHVLNGLIIDEYRKRKSSSLDVLMESGFEPTFDDRDTLLDVLDGKAAILQIAKLPEKYRSILSMRYVRDLSLTEIALITKQTKNAISVQICRGLEKLKVLVPGIVI